MSSVLTIRGGVPLTGRVHVRGAKNLVPKAMVAALLGNEPSVLRNVPEIKDVEVVTSLLQLHGVTVDKDPVTGDLTLDPKDAKTAPSTAIDAHAGDSRIPILLCGPLIHSIGEAFIPDLGGCKIGDRPIDYHLNVLRQFGAVVEKRPGGIHISAPKGLHGAKISLPYPSVGATEQVLLSATRAEGITELSGAATEPEIVDLIAVLQKMGAIISVQTDRTIRIEGVRDLGGYNHRALSDRNESASWASAALVTRGDIFVEGASQRDMMTFLNTFRKVGGGMDIGDDGIRFYHRGGSEKDARGDGLFTQLRTEISECQSVISLETLYKVWVAKARKDDWNGEWITAMQAEFSAAKKKLVADQEADDPGATPQMNGYVSTLQAG